MAVHPAVEGDGCGCMAGGQIVVGHAENRRQRWLSVVPDEWLVVANTETEAQAGMAIVVERLRRSCSC